MDACVHAGRMMQLLCEMRQRVLFLLGSSLISSVAGSFGVVVACVLECDITNDLGESAVQYECSAIRRRQMRLRADSCRTFSSIDGELANTHSLSKSATQYIKCSTICGSRWRWLHSVLCETFGSIDGGPGNAWWQLLSHGQGWRRERRVIGVANRKCAYLFDVSTEEGGTRRGADVPGSARLVELFCVLSRCILQMCLCYCF